MNSLYLPKSSTSRSSILTKRKKPSSSSPILFPEICIFLDEKAYPPPSNLGSPLATVPSLYSNLSAKRHVGNSNLTFQEYIHTYLYTIKQSAQPLPNQPDTIHTYTYTHTYTYLYRTL